MHAIQQQAKDIRQRLRQPSNAVRDRGINLSRPASFFGIRGWQEDAFRCQRLKQQDVPAVPLEKIVLHSRCGASFIVVPQMTTPQESNSSTSYDGHLDMSGVPSMSDIIRATCEVAGVSYGDLLSNQRTHRVCRPRMLAMYLARRLTHRSLPEIGRRFGGKDHTTALNAINKFSWLDKALNLPRDAAPIDWVREAWAMYCAHTAPVKSKG